MSSTVVLAFDIGIRNLAWCLLEGGDTPKIIDWQNYDLLTGQSANTHVVKVTCSKCTNKGVYTSPLSDTPTCLRHCPSTHPPLKDLSGGIPYKRIPNLNILRKLAPTVKSATKAKLVEAIRQLHSVPVEVVKLKKAIETELTSIHDSIRAFVEKNIAIFRRATVILLENQPVLKNPTMKSVQILLFATLRDMLQPGPPPLKLVHAGKKIQGKEVGDKGYKSRKDASEGKVEELLKGGKISEAPRWLEYFHGHGKKSDLADAFCMCWDRISAS